MTPLQTVADDVRDRVARITLDRPDGAFGIREAPVGSAIHPSTILANHDSAATWDPMVDYAWMSRNVRAFMSLFH